jgi:hypothetical protein
LKLLARLWKIELEMSVERATTSRHQEDDGGIELSPIDAIDKISVDQPIIDQHQQKVNNYDN